jgi:hypothetical protein
MLFQKEIGDRAALFWISDGPKLRARRWRLLALEAMTRVFRAVGPASLADRG